MPPVGETPFTQAEFNLVTEWFLRGAPMADSILPAETRPTECVPEVNPDVAAYVAERETNSWTTANAAAGMLMYGCAGATNALPSGETEKSPVTRRVKFLVPSSPAPLMAGSESSATPPSSRSIAYRCAKFAPSKAVKPRASAASSCRSSACARSSA